MLASRSGSAAHEPDEVEDADDVALWSAAVWEIFRIAGLGIATLCARAMDIEQLIGAGPVGR